MITLQLHGSTLVRAAYKVMGSLSLEAFKNKLEKHLFVTVLADLI